MGGWAGGLLLRDGGDGGWTGGMGWWMVNGVPRIFGDVDVMMFNGDLGGEVCETWFRVAEGRLTPAGWKGPSDVYAEGRWICGPWGYVSYNDTPLRGCHTLR